ncbi:unnamed protein product, partial [Notodromas monacha]
MQSAQVISAPPVGCPNPRFVQVLIDMRDEEKSLSSRKRRSIIKVVALIRSASPLPFSAASLAADV